MLTCHKVNDLLGLKNIKALEGLTAFLTKTDLPLTVYNDVDQEVLTSPVVTLQDRKLMYFCGMTAIIDLLAPSD